MSDTLRSDLQRQIEGEVRFDPVSRALYSTDASVYRIEPLGIVVPLACTGRPTMPLLNAPLGPIG